jgi:type IV pilus assembly protein PilM
MGEEDIQNSIQHTAHSTQNEDGNDTGSGLPGEDLFESDGFSKLEETEQQVKTGGQETGAVNQPSEVGLPRDADVSPGTDLDPFTAEDQGTGTEEQQTKDIPTGTVPGPSTTDRSGPEADGQQAADTHAEIDFTSFYTKGHEPEAEEQQEPDISAVTDFNPSPAKGPKPEVKSPSSLFTTNSQLVNPTQPGIVSKSSISADTGFGEQARQTINNNLPLATRHLPLSIQERFDGKSKRSWYTFNGLRFILGHNRVTLVGSGEWPGFGVDTENGRNGEPFIIGNNNCIEFDISGQAEGRINLELTDFSGAVESVLFTPNAAQPHQKLLLRQVKGKLSKLQFIFPSGEINCTLRNIGFSRAKELLSNVFVPTLAFDIGANFLKMALVDNHHNPLLLEYAEIPVTETREDRLNAITHLIRGLLIKHKLKAPKLSFVISPQTPVYRRLRKKAPVKKEELENFLRKELLPLVPFPAEQVTISYLVNTKEQDDFLLTAILPAELHFYSELGQRSGLEIACALDINTALAKLYELLYPEDEAPVVLLDIGARKTAVLILEKGRILYARRLKPGCAALEGSFTAAGKPPADQLEVWLNELTRSLAYFTDQEPSLALTRLMICGGGALLPGLIPALTEHLGLSVQPLFSAAVQKFQQTIHDHGPRIALFAPVLGLAISHPEELVTANVFRTFPDKKNKASAIHKPPSAQELYDRVPKQWLRFFLGGLLLLMLLALFLWLRTEQMERSLGAKRTQLKDSQAQAASAELILQGVKQKETLLVLLRTEKKFLQLCTTLTAPVEGIVLTSLERLAGGRQVVVTGEVASEIAIQKYLAYLHKSRAIKELQLAQVQRNGAVTMFRIVLQLREEQ